MRLEDYQFEDIRLKTITLCEESENIMEQLGEEDVEL
jgi:hypothetical protein